MPVYLIPFAKSVTPGTITEVVTVITITRVGGTASCEASVDWMTEIGTTVAATTKTTLSPPGEKSHNVGDTDNHCSHTSFPVNVVTSCEGDANLFNYEGKAVIGVKSPCTAANLAVDARVIYLNVSTGAPIAIHSLKVLKPHNQGNRGE